MNIAWRGLFKVTEECGELLQVLGKLGPFPSGTHPDGGPNLRIRLAQEIADVEASLEYFKEANHISEDLVRRLKQEKLDKFRRWGLTGIPNHPVP